jgi:hypothetical protein
MAVRGKVRAAQVLPSMAITCVHFDEPGHPVRSAAVRLLLSTTMSVVQHYFLAYLRLHHLYGMNVAL